MIAMLIVAALSGQSRLATQISSLSPNEGVALASIGVGLIFLELNRPGRILPGFLGLTLLLLAAGCLLHHPLRPLALLFLLLGSVTLTANLWRQLPWQLLGAAILALVFGLRLLVSPAGAHISTPVALTCGLGVGLLATALSRVAFRARRLKAVH